jgi:hypothetical protein
MADSPLPHNVKLPSIVDAAGPFEELVCEEHPARLWDGGAGCCGAPGVPPANLRTEDNRLAAPRYVLLVHDGSMWQIEWEGDDYTEALIEHRVMAQSFVAFVADAQEHDDE